MQKDEVAEGSEEIEDTGEQKCPGQNTVAKQRWRFTLTLRTFLGITAAAALASEWTARQFVRKGQQNEYVFRTIEEQKDGQVNFYSRSWFTGERVGDASSLLHTIPPPEGVVEQFLHRHLGRWDKDIYALSLTDATIKDLGNILRAVPSLEFLDCKDTDLTDADMAYIGQLSELKNLVLSGTSITDAGLVHLKGLTHLAYLELDGTQLTDAGLNSLSTLPRLAFLHLRNTKVTDAGLAHLENVKTLAFLSLDGTAVTDTGLVNLQNLPVLLHVGLGDTHITQRAAVRLEQTLEEHRTQVYMRSLQQEE